MKKSILNTAIFIITVFLLSGIAVNETPADDKVKKIFLKGFIIDGSGNKVTEGFLNIYCKDNVSCESQLLECVIIQSNGSFITKIPLPPDLNGRMPIAAYPYDLDKGVIHTTVDRDIEIASYPYDLDRIQEPNTSKTITIAAYPYDLDNSGVVYEPVEIEMDHLIYEEGKNEIEIIIRIKRSNLEKIIPGDKDGSDKTSKREADLEKSSEVKLNQNYPNPFNPSTLISFNLPDAENVTLQVYGLSGKLISTLINNKYLPAGNRHVQFNADNLPSGVYIYKLTAGDQTLTHKMMLLK